MDIIQTTDPFCKVLISDILMLAERIERLTGQSCALYLHDARHAQTARQLAEIHGELADWLKDAQDERRKKRADWLDEYGYPLMVMGVIIGGIVLLSLFGAK